MFYGKKIKAIEKRLAKAEQFEKGVCTVIDNYFATNEKKDLKFSTDCVCDKFYHFVKSTDDRINKFENAIADGELVSKEWHDEQVLHLQEENEKLKLLCNEYATRCKEIYNIGINSVKEKQSIINAQEKEIKSLAKTKKSTAKGGKK